MARAYARTAVERQGPRPAAGQAASCSRWASHGDVVAEALAEVFGDVDERALIAQALQKKLRGRTKLADRQEYARLYQYLMRQGFSPAGVVAALRDSATGVMADQD